MRRSLFILIVLSLAMFAWAQPLEGPWTVLEMDSNLAVAAPVIAAHGGAVEIFFTVNDSVTNEIQHLSYSLETHQVLSGPVTLRRDTSMSQRVIDVAVQSNGEWAALLNAWWEHGTSMHCITGDTAGYRDLFVAYGPHVVGNYYYLSRYFSDQRVHNIPGGGFIVSWLSSGTSPPPVIEYFGAGQIAYVDGDSISAIQGIVPNDMFQGPDQIAALPLTHDLTLGLLLGVSFEMWPSTLALIPRYGGDYFYRGIRGDCEPTVMDLQRTHGGRILALDRQSWGYPRPGVVEMDTLGNCTELGRSQWPSYPGTPAWNPNSGWVIPYRQACCILIARFDTLGQEILPVGVMFERDSVWSIGDVSVALTDSGVIAAAWNEIDHAGVSRRLRIATVGWNTFLGSDDRDFIPLPSSLILSAFPNPFNSTLKIEYTLPNAQNIKLSVFNVLGQKVETLVAAQMESGTHTMTWNPTCAGGVYFVALKTETEFKTTKVLYIR